MMKLKNLNENFDLVRLALSRWQHDADTLDERLSHFRISSNAVYPFDRQGRLHFLRLSPADEREAVQIQAELEFLLYLREQRYPAMRPIPAHNGIFLHTLDTPWGVYHACVFEGVSGVPVEDTNGAAHVMQRYGEALGRLHALSAEYEPVVARQSWQDKLAWISRVLLDYGAPKYLHEACARIGQALFALPVSRETYGLIHYDFEPDNVFWDEAADCCRVIDFDDSMYHFYLTDVEQALDAVGDMLEGEALAAAREQFMTGYRRHFPLPEDYMAQLPLMRDFCDLYACARLLRSLSEKPEVMPDWMPGLCRRLQWRLDTLSAKFAEKL